MKLAISQILLQDNKLFESSHECQQMWHSKVDLHFHDVITTFETLEGSYNLILIDTFTLMEIEVECQRPLPKGEHDN